MAEGGAYGPSQTHGLESPFHVAWDGRRRVGWRTTDGGAYGPSQTHGLESPCHVAWAFQPMSGRPRIAGRSVTR